MHGLTDLAEGDATAAVGRLRADRQRWTEIEALYEVARARVALAEAHLTQGEAEAAAMQLRNARATFDRLGQQLHAIRPS